MDIVWLILLFIMMPFLVYIFYCIIRIAVTNGVYDALKKIENEKEKNKDNNGDNVNSKE